LNCDCIIAALQERARSLQGIWLGRCREISGTAPFHRDEGNEKSGDDDGDEPLKVKGRVRWLTGPKCGHVRSSQSRVP
jgi:hypothetical protein